MEIESILATQLKYFKEEGLIKDIIANGKIVEISAGTSILNEGSYVKTIPLLLSGLIRVVSQEAGKEMLLYYIYPLESCIVSIQCGMNDLKSRVKAISEDQSKALLLPSHSIAEWQRKYPSFNNFVLNLYQKRFYNLLDTFNELAFHKLDDRVTTFLIAKSKALKTERLQMTHQDLADELGTARESISRMLKKLESEGKVRLHRGSIEIM